MDRRCSIVQDTKCEEGDGDQHDSHRRIDHSDALFLRRCLWSRSKLDSSARYSARYAPNPGTVSECAETARPSTSQCCASARYRSRGVSIASLWFCHGVDLYVHRPFDGVSMYDAVCDSSASC